jgi:hypothetical protein
MFPAMLINADARWSVERSGETVSSRDIMMKPAPASLIEGKASWFPVTSDKVELSIDMIPNGETIDVVVWAMREMHVIKKIKLGSKRNVFLTENTISHRRTAHARKATGKEVKNS